MTPVPKSKTTDISEARVWQYLDTMNARLLSIEENILTVVRLEERFHNHTSSLNRITGILDRHDKFFRENERSHAALENLSVSIQRLEKRMDDNPDLKETKDHLDKLEKRVETLEKGDSRNKGQKDIGKEILKALVVILTGIIVYKVTRG